MSRKYGLAARAVARATMPTVSKHVVGKVEGGLRTRTGGALYLNPWQSLSTAGGGSEQKLEDILKSKVGASRAVVEDISGGCGSMYRIEVESPRFMGKALVAQHRMVKDALKEEIAEMHGLTLITRASTTT